MFTGSYDGAVALWTTDGVMLWRRRGHEGHVNSTSFSPDASCIASGGDDGSIALWSADGALLWQVSGKAAHKRYRGRDHGICLSPEEVRGICFSPDGRRIAAGTYDGNVALWSAGGDLLWQVPGVPGNADIKVTFMGICFSPDGRRIAAGTQDGTVALWADDGAPLWSAPWAWKRGFSNEGGPLGICSARTALASLLPKTA